MAARRRCGLGAAIRPWGPRVRAGTYPQELGGGQTKRTEPTRALRCPQPRASRCPFPSRGSKAKGWGFSHLLRFPFGEAAVLGANLGTASTYKDSLGGVQALRCPPPLPGLGSPTSGTLQKTVAPLLPEAHEEQTSWAPFGSQGPNSSPLRGPRPSPQVASRAFCVVWEGSTCPKDARVPVPTPQPEGCGGKVQGPGITEKSEVSPSSRPSQPRPPVVCSEPCKGGPSRQSPRPPGALEGRVRRPGDSRIPAFRALASFQRSSSNF